MIKVSTRAPYKKWSRSLSPSRDTQLSRTLVRVRSGSTASQQDCNARDIIRTVIGPNPKGRLLTTIKEVAKQQQLANGHLRTLNVTCSWQAPKDIAACNVGMVEHYLRTALIEAFNDFISDVEKRNSSTKVRYSASDKKLPALSVYTNTRPALNPSFEFFTQVKVTFDRSINF